MVKPESKTDQGLHKILIEIQINSAESFNILEILVKLPITYIASDLKPLFLPPLEN
jgi:hypothetical protein